MDHLCSSIFGPLYPQNDVIFQTQQQLQAQEDQIIIPTQQQEVQQDDHDHDHDLDHLLLQIPPTFLEHHDDHHQGLTNHNQGTKTSLSLPFDDHNHDHDDDENLNDKKKRQRMAHREIERQRRLEMSSLHGSLRSLLPLEYVKGKRSMSEHLNQTVRYIKHLQQKIETLSDQRDALKSQVSESKSRDDDDGDGDGDGGHDVRVNHCNEGVEVIVCTNCGVNEGLPLSRVLQCLIKQGLDVVNCISNKVNNKLVHSIQVQVADGRSTAVDAVELQQKLADIHI